jgi:hypothetical protein
MPSVLLEERPQHQLKVSCTVSSGHDGLKPAGVDPVCHVKRPGPDGPERPARAISAYRLSRIGPAGLPPSILPSIRLVDDTAGGPNA